MIEKTTYVTIWSRQPATTRWLIERTHSIEYARQWLTGAEMATEVEMRRTHSRQNNHPITK